jgi:Tol biopolymer transport system component
MSIRGFVAIVLCLGALMSACGSDPTEPVSGALELTISTTGVPDDPDGYAVTVDHGAARRLASNGTDTIAALSPGPHTVELTGVVSFCVLDGENPRTVEIAPGDTASVRFDITCDTPVLEISVSTTGFETDYDGYHVSIDDQAVVSMLPNDTTRIPYLSSGTHTIALRDVEPNCAVTGEHPRTFSIVDGAGSVHFDVVCHIANTLFVSVESSGGDSDPDGFVATVNGGSRIGIVGGASSFGGGWFLLPGDYTVVLSDVAPHCMLSGSNTARATVVSEESAIVSFSVTCGRLRTAPPGHDLLVIAKNDIHLLSADGSRFLNLTNDRDYDFSAAWSPDGRRFAFAAVHTALDDPNCVPSPLGPSCGTHLVSHVFMMNADGSGRLQLTDGEREEGPAWSPDGSKIAYIGVSADSTSHVFVMNADGSEQTPLTSLAGQLPFLSPVPVWSPDGRRIAYSDLNLVRPGILVVNADGSGETRLTDAYDRSAAWSPDGTRIAFVRFVLGQVTGIYVMNADGSGLAQVASDTGGGDPYLSWSPDGTKIAFGLDNRVYLVNGNGTGLTQLTFGPLANFSTWSPDGSSIAYSLAQEPWRVYLMSLDGSGEVPLTPAGVEAYLASPAAWRP